MSGSDRAAVRAQAATALASVPGLDEATRISAWAQSVDAKALPAYAVATPSERSSPETFDTEQRDLTLIAVLKRLGGDDIEDVLDGDADLIEAAIYDAIRSENRLCALVQSDTRVDGDGGQRVGTITMTFTVTYWTQVR
ncbi:hypothetical protein ACTTAI_16340 [Rhodobacter capsulatus]|uniref:hypothetical protein n=1 Tax=Rhodobacter capsulatus TaxID=1061 RepID=UPI00402932BC